jgi:CheY-like chemotaxis protein
MNILLVEDSAFLRAAISRTLSKAGHQVTGVGDGRKALHAARTSLPEIIFLDMMLPGLDGMAVMKELHDDPVTAKIPIVVLSGLAQMNESRMKKAGAAAYIEKGSLDLKNNSDLLLRIIESVAGKTVQPPLALPLVESALAPEIVLADTHLDAHGRGL